MNKQKLKSKMSENIRASISELIYYMELIKIMTGINENYVPDPNDKTSHDYEAWYHLQSFQKQINNLNKQLTELQNIDFSPTKLIKPGAIIKTDKINFVLGTEIFPFKYGYNEYSGISINAVIYKNLEGKNRGDHFIFENQQFQIKNIL